jgi:hypothetical protein
MCRDVDDQMLEVHRSELAQFNDLTAFLDLKLAFVSAYHDRLVKLKEDWPDMCLPFRRDGGPKFNVIVSVYSTRP